MTATSLARKYCVDVSLDNVTWLRLAAVNDRAKNVNPNKIDATTYDGTGWTSTEVTLQSWTLVVKALRQPSAGIYDPAQELARATQGTFGDSIRLYVRTYDKFTGKEAQSGRAIVEWNESKTGVADLNEVQITFTGDGALSNVADVTISAVPVVSAALPSAAAVSTLVVITGQGFTGTIATTGVKFGAVNATSWSVVSDSTIVAIVPAGSAGSAPIVVTNATGASVALAYTRGS